MTPSTCRQDRSPPPRKKIQRSPLNGAVGGRVRWIDPFARFSPAADNTPFHTEVPRSSHCCKQAVVSRRSNINVGWACRAQPESVRCTLGPHACAPAEVSPAPKFFFLPNRMFRRLSHPAGRGEHHFSVNTTAPPPQVCR